LEHTFGRITLLRVSSGGYVRVNKK